MEKWNQHSSLQLSLNELSTNRDYAGAQAHINLRKDNLRALKLLADKPHGMDNLSSLSLNATKEDG